MPSFAIAPAPAEQETAPIATSSTLAVLPAQMLYVAAQFASKDHAKEGLTYINVRKSGDTITIASTDGHRLFRVRIPAENAYFLERELMLSPMTFKKRITKAAYTFITDQGMAETRGVIPGLIQSVPCPSGCDFSFPEYERLIPDTYSGNADAPIAFSANYLAAFLKEVARFCDNGTVKMQFNMPTTPLLFTGESTLDGSGIQVTMEYLLMPICIRG